MSVKWVFNYPAFNEFRNQPAIQRELHERGERVAEAAGGNPDFVVLDEPSRSRARVVVITATAKGMAAEARDRALTRAIDAGRG